MRPYAMRMVLRLVVYSRLVTQQVFLLNLMSHLLLVAPVTWEEKTPVILCPRKVALVFLVQLDLGLLLNVFRLRRQQLFTPYSPTQVFQVNL